MLSQAFRDELEDEAAHVYDRFARKYYGRKCLTNFDEDGVFLDPKNLVARRAPSDSSGNTCSSSSASAGAVDYRGVTLLRKMQKWQANVCVCVCIQIFMKVTSANRI